MQDEDDERQDLERALYARPTGDDRDEALRAEAQRIEAQRAEALRAEAQRRLPAAAAEVQPAPRAAGPARTTGEPSIAAPPTRSRLVLLGAGLLVGGLAIGAATASVIGAAVPQPSSSGPATATGTPTPRATDRFAAIVEGWAVTTDIPTGLSLISGDAEVYSPTFETTQNDRLLLTAPDATRICLALERPDGSLSAGCTGLEAFFAGDALDVVGTATGDDTPVYTRVTLRPDGSIEGGFQLVATPGPEA